MRITIRVLASGSSGNALFLRAGETRILVDAGIPAARIERGLAELGESADALDAVLLTHEHADHVRGLGGLLAPRPELRVLATAGTRRALESARGDLGKSGLRPAWGAALVAARGVDLGQLRLRPFPLPHDAAEPVGFRFEAGDRAIGLATDLGSSTPVVERSLAGCSVLILEANHDLDLLARGPYPVFLKRRVASHQGHLSNAQAASLLQRLAGPALRHVVLAHLSRTNNRPDAALRTVAPALADCRDLQLSVGRPQAPGEPIELLAGPAAAAEPGSMPTTEGLPRQLGLFD
ncbi:MAG: MBL fold metallo-hydrolase [Chloroflexi bacterium]|nr:MBL fold metallo-hydrolase [Chloroflexota bacterium]